jgi:hypothetical protein
MSLNNPQNKVSPLTRIYEAGSVLRVQFALHVGKGRQNDTVYVHFYPTEVTPEFFQAVFDEKAVLFAGIMFEQERKKFLKEHYPERYKELFQ